jgi:general stress protein 26
MRGSTPDAMGRFREILSKFDTAMLVTRRQGLEFHGRPMAVAQVEADGKLWFVTSIDAPKLVELAADSQALVCMQGGSKFVTINGRVDVVRDPKKIDEMWRESFRVWFDGKNDPKLVLLRLTPFEGEYWDQSGIRGLKYAFRAAKALIKDQKVEQSVDQSDTHGHVKQP